MGATATETSSIGQNIRERRKAKGLTQAELAAIIGFDTAYLCRLETGHHEPAVRTLAKVAKALGCDVLKLLRGRK